MCIMQWVMIINDAGTLANQISNPCQAESASYIHIV